MKQARKPIIVLFMLVTVILATCVTAYASASPPSGYKSSKGKVSVTSVKLEKAAYAVNKGSSIKINCAVSPSNATNKNVTWKSSNVSVATVDAKGIVKGIKPGKATITATAKDGSKKSSSCTVTVAQPVTAISVTGNTSLILGSSTQLKVTVSPTSATNKNVTWTSSNAKIATVNDSGRVFAVSEGSVTITAKAKDGSGKKGTFKFTAKTTGSITKLTMSTVGISSSDCKNVSFGVYQDAACTKLAGTISMNSQGGFTTVSLIPQKTYYLKEIKGPKAFASVKTVCKFSTPAHGGTTVVKVVYGAIA